jgi:hypothetical protein
LETIVNRILPFLAAAALLSLSACGGDPCAKLTKDVCGDGDKTCAAWVAKDLLEGNTEKATCKFLTDDTDYKKWLVAAKKARAEAAK